MTHKDSITLLSKGIKTCVSDYYSTYYFNEFVSDSMLSLTAEHEEQKTHRNHWSKLVQPGFQILLCLSPSTDRRP